MVKLEFSNNLECIDPRVRIEEVNENENENQLTK